MQEHCAKQIVVQWATFQKHTQDTKTKTLCDCYAFKYAAKDNRY